MVNRFLRTAPTSRLLGVIAGLAVAIAAGTTIAIAAVGVGPVPPRKPLAAAIHQALAASAPAGISGSVSFTNNLISSSEIQGSDPILSGGSGRFWITGNALRLELQGDNGDANAVARNGSFWAYDPASNTVYEGTLPAYAGAGNSRSKTGKDSGTSEAIPSVKEIETTLSHLAGHLRISGAKPGDVAGWAAYTVRISPKQSGGLLGATELAWDAARGVPLRFAIYARGDSTPVLSLKATGISYGSVPASVFSISPPSGAKVVHVSLPAGNATAENAGRHRTAGAKRHQAAITGPAAVAKHLSFALSAPASAAGLRRSSVSLLGTDGALVLYGRPLGGVAVIEQVAKPGTTRLPSLGPSAGGDQPGLTLPSVAVGGSSGQEIDTALGTVVRFVRGGVAYTVLGSVKPSVAVAAARAL